VSTRRIGYIVGETDTLGFHFVSDTESFPPRHEYLLIPGVRERMGSGFEDVDVLAQVTRIVNYSDILGERLSLRELEAVIGRYGGSTKVYGEAIILGYMDADGNVLIPRSAAKPGQEVYIAPTDMLERFFARDVVSGIPVGGLITRPEVRVSVDPNGFRRHLAIIAQTGAGKSYLVGLIMERLIPAGATIIVFDPNSDYVLMRRGPSGSMTSIANDITIYRPPGVSGRRYSDAEIGGSTQYMIDFSSLDLEEVVEVAGISERWTNISAAVEEASKLLEGFYGPQQLIDALLSISKNEDEKKKIREGAESAIKYIRRLLKYPVWGSVDIPVDDLLRPRHLSVIDLAGLQKRVSEYVVRRTLDEVWSRAVTGSLDFPVFVVLEEAHNFVPAPGLGPSASSRTIEKISAEGRKFGIFLTIVTQRPNKVSPNALSQCNSQIIMRLTNPDDISAVRRSSEGLSEALFGDLPGLNRGEAIIVGELTRIPTMVKVTGRQSGEGGSDIDVAAALARARQAADTAALAKPSGDKPEEPRSKW